VGKGTQAQLLCDSLRTCHLSTGDLFRAAKCDASPTAAMRAALAAMQRGELVSDELVIAMVRERSGCLHCRGGFLLDGFPRTVRQAEALTEILDEQRLRLDAVLSFELPLDEIVARLSGRRTCGECRAVFHVEAQPPKVADVCDFCGGPLLQRDDDQPEAIRVRMQVYENETRPLADFYAAAGNLVRIPATGTPEQIRDRTLATLQSCVR
jgi:adenylate kinase